MKAIRALKIVLKDTVMSGERAYLEEAIAELEELETKITEQEEALAVDRLMNQKLQERNRELSNQIALNNPFSIKSCENCKQWVGNAPFKGFCNVTGSSCCLGGCNDYFEPKQ